MQIDRSNFKDRSDASERHWGVWYLSKSKPLSLNIYPDLSPNPYEIELIRVNSPEKVLAWITHLIESKRWLDVDDIRDFMKACHTLQKEGLTPTGEENRDKNWGY